MVPVAEVRVMPNTSKPVNANQLTTAKKVIRVSQKLDYFTNNELGTTISWPRGPMRFDNEETMVANASEDPVRWCQLLK